MCLVSPQVVVTTAPAGPNVLANHLVVLKTKILITLSVLTVLTS
jgi:hypothetical protein